MRAPRSRREKASFAAQTQIHRWRKKKHKQQLLADLACNAVWRLGVSLWLLKFFVWKRKCFELRWENAVCLCQTNHFWVFYFAVSEWLNTTLKVHLCCSSCVARGPGSSWLNVRRRGQPHLWPIELSFYRNENLKYADGFREDGRRPFAREKRCAQVRPCRTTHK